MTSANNETARTGYSLKFLTVVLGVLLAVVGVSQFPWIRRALAQSRPENTQSLTLTDESPNATPASRRLSTTTLRSGGANLLAADEVTAHKLLTTANATPREVRSQSDYAVIAQSTDQLPVNASQNLRTQFEKIRRPRVVEVQMDDPSNPGEVITLRQVVEEEVYVPRRTEVDKTSIRVRELSSQLGALSEDKRPAELMAELKELITEQFNQRHQSQLQRLEKILADAKTTEDLLKRREEQKDEIISRRMLELLGERDPLNWDYQPGARLDSLLSEALPPPGDVLSDNMLATEDRYLADSGPLDVAPRNNMVPPAMLPEQPDLPPSAPLGLGPSRQSQRPNQSRWNDPFGNGSQLNGQEDSFAAGAPVAGREDPFANTPVPSGSDDPFGNGVSIRPATASIVATTNDFISLAYRLKGLKHKFKVVKSQFEMGIIHQTEFMDVQNSFEEAQAQWEYKKREIAGQLEAAKLELQLAKDKLDLLTRYFSTTGGPDSEKQIIEAKKEAIGGDRRLRLLIEQQEWLNKFEESLTGDVTPKAESEKSANGPIEEEDAANKDSDALPVEEGLTPAR